MKKQSIILLSFLAFSFASLCANENARQLVISSVKETLSRPFQTKLTYPDEKRHKEFRIRFFYQPQADGKYLVKLPWETGKINKVIYIRNGLFQVEDTTNYGKKILLNETQKTIRGRHRAGGELILALNTFQNIEKVATMPGVIFAMEPDIYYEKNIPCHVVRMSQATESDDLLLQLGVDTDEFKSDKQAYLKSITPDAYFKWIIGKENHFIYAFFLEIPGIDRKVTTKAIPGEWWTEEAKMPVTFQENFFTPPDTPFKKSFSSREEYLDALEFTPNQPAHQNNVIQRTIKRQMRSLHSVSWLILVFSAVLLLFGIFLYCRKRRKKEL